MCKHPPALQENSHTSKDAKRHNQMALDSNISPETGYYDSDFRGFPQSVQATVRIFSPACTLSRRISCRRGLTLFE
jgi:hypothetical protein